MIVYSSRVEKLLQTRKESASDLADCSCTSGYDNDGSTGYEIFENGYNLCKGAEGRNAYSGEAGDTTYFILAKDEDEAVKIVQGWSEDEDE